MRIIIKNPYRPSTKYRSSSFEWCRKFRKINANTWSRLHYSFVNCQYFFIFGSNNEGVSLHCKFWTHHSFWNRSTWEGLNSKIYVLSTCGFSKMVSHALYDSSCNLINFNDMRLKGCFLFLGLYQDHNHSGTQRWT